MHRTLSAALASLLLVAIAPAASATVPTHFRSDSFGGTLQDKGLTVAYDTAGNLFVVGSALSASVDMGGGPLAQVGPEDMVLAKYTPTGAHVWSKRFALSGFYPCQYIAVDAEGNVYLCGSASTNVDLGGGNLVFSGSSDVVLAKFDNDGNHLWSQIFGDGSLQEPTGITVTPAGTIYLSGNVSGSIDFGGGNQSSVGGSDVFLASFDTDGFYLWSNLFGSAAADYTWGALALDPNGDLFFGCETAGTIDLGNGSLPNAGGYDIAVAKYAADGTHIWSQSFGSTSTEWLPSLTVDSGGFLTIVPSGLGSIDFGGGALPVSYWTTFLVRFDGDGNHLWGQSLYSTDAPGDFVESYCVSASPSNGDLFVGLRLRGVLTLGSDTAIAGGFSDAALARFTPDGTPCWLQDWGGPTGFDEYVQDVAFNGSGALAVTGPYSSTMTFDSGSITTNGIDDIFVLVFDEHAAEPAITSITDIGNDQGGEVKLRFDRSGYDQIGSPSPVLAYEAYRRDDPAPSATAGDEPALLPPDRDTLTPAELAVLGWTYVGSAPAHGDAGYGLDVPTIGDSTIVGGGYDSFFFVRAATGDPYTFFDSAPDSGYSLDNLAPSVPLSLVFDTGLLTWDESPAEDFDYFTVYGANVDDFGAAVVVNHAVAPTLDVSAAPYPHYFVTATDFSGNESGPAGLSSTVGVGDTPRTYVLSVTNHPNPFRGATRVNYTLASPGHVTVAVYDPRGARVATLVDETLEAGAHGATWDGRSGTGEFVSAGIYFARIVHDGQVRTRKMLLSR